jgi:hypothetical protein
MPTTPDNRVRLPAAKIDFATDVGVASQDHDDYPPPQGQARFDHMRMFLIGLLSQQSSFLEPTEFRDGTPWFDLNTLQLKIRLSGAWVSYAEAIVLEEDDDGTTTLADWFNAVSSSLGTLAPEVIFNGTATADSQISITIPESLRIYLFADSRPIVYKNGLLLDPRNSNLDSGSNPTSVGLTGGDELDTGDTFTVMIRRVPNETWYIPNVSVP